MIAWLRNAPLPSPLAFASAIAVAAALGLSACGEDAGVDESPLSTGGSAGNGGAAGSGGSAGSAGAGGCPTEDTRFEQGDPNGHADPYGAKAAGEARAGRLTSDAMIVQPAHGRQRVRVDDFVLANDKIAVTIEGTGVSDGYARFGGELLAVDHVGADGRPKGESYYVETLYALSIEMVKAEQVTVMNDGSDGKAAVVRVTGKLEPIPFLDTPLFGVIFSRRYGVQAAYEYVLEPGAEHVTVRFGLINPREEALDFELDEMHGFFQSNHNQYVAADQGFASATGKVAYAGFVPRAGGATSFAYRPAGGETLTAAIEISGFQYFTGPGFVAPQCATTWVDHMEVIVGGPDFDGLQEAIRRVDGVAPWREVTGSVQDASGNPIADAWVHATVGERYISRTRSAQDGSYSIHLPEEAVTLIPQVRGYPLDSGQSVAATATTADLTLGTVGTISVDVTEQGGGALPVRVQVIPVGGYEPTPETFGVLDEARRRLHNEFAMDGKVTVPVPPGDHRVIVSRGYEWELLDQTVTVAAGANVDVTGSLEHSVDTTGYLCADFHIHSHQSADSPDPIVHKVKGAIADGLDIPVSSEHEWVVDFQPIVEDLGMQSWAFGMASEELTTFSWGHFGVVPLTPRPDSVNNGAMEWIGKEPPAMFDDVSNLPEDPFFIINHPRGSTISGYFSAARLDPATGEGEKANLWSTNFDGIEVFNDSSLDESPEEVADWFALLNAGHTFWAVGSSDSHKIRTSPVGYPRTCIDFGHDDFTQLSPEAVRDALRTGATTISGGLFMTTAGPGGEGPGATVVDGSGSVEFTVTVQAPSWLDATELEVIVDGTVQSTQTLMPMGTGTAKRFVNSVTVTFDPSKDRSFVVFHARGSGDLTPLHPDRAAFAVTNPVFLKGS